MVSLPSADVMYTDQNNVVQFTTCLTKLEDQNSILDKDPACCRDVTGNVQHYTLSALRYAHISHTGPWYCTEEEHTQHEMLRNKDTMRLLLDWNLLSLSPSCLNASPFPRSLHTCSLPGLPRRSQETIAKLIRNVFLSSKYRPDKTEPAYDFKVYFPPDYMSCNNKQTEIFSFFNIRFCISKKIFSFSCILVFSQAAVYIISILL